MAALNALFAQANAEANTLSNEGQTVYDQQMAASQAATVAGNQEMQQANVANQNAAVQTQKAANEAQVMATTGASGTLYQQNLTSQNNTFGFNPQTLDRTQQLQNQEAGTAKTALNQLDNVQGGTRGLSAAGVEAKAQGITTQANTVETQLGQSIKTQENEATTAAAYASSESQYVFTQEQEAEKSYTDAATQYISSASTYQSAAKSSYNAAANYAVDASANRALFSGAAAEVGLTALKAATAINYHSMAVLAQSEAQFNKSNVSYLVQKNAFDKQQNALQVQAQQQIMSSYKSNISVGMSDSEAKRLAEMYVS